jgi:D-3-phosphoglycerate dehydrogenase / 2-oxoglutarate reductase
MPSVLITAKEIHPIIPERLRKLGYEVVMLPEPDEATLLSKIGLFEGLIFTTYTKVNQALLDAALRLKFAGRVGSGLENVDLAHAAGKGVVVFNSPEGNANAVGEHTLGLLLAVFNNIVRANAELKQGIWKREANRGLELDGRTVGIVGFGHTGSAFARKLRGFEVEILVYDKYKSGFGGGQIVESSMEEIAEKADVISFHVPYTDETHHMMDQRFFQHLNKQPVILQTCRGEVMDTVAALDALEKGKIYGLGIDVFEDEPWTNASKVPYEVYQQLWQHPRVVATPHIAGWTVESKELLASVLMDKIEAWLQQGKV